VEPKLCKKGHSYFPVLNAKGKLKECPECNRVRARAWNASNKERHRARSKKWVENNRERHLAKVASDYASNRKERIAKTIAWQRANPDKYNAKQRAWCKANLGKMNAKTAKRHAAKMQRTPKWLTNQHYEQIKEIYLSANALGLTVDHIVPLQGANVSGLHVPWNLRLLPASINYAKGNKTGGV